MSFEQATPLADDRGQAIADDCTHEIDFRGKVSVHRSPPDAGPSGDFVERYRQALIGERLVRGFKYASTVAGGVGSRRT